LLGANIVASLQGIGKPTIANAFKKGNFPLFAIGDVNADLKSVETQAIKLICASYGKITATCNSMTEYRVKSWRMRTARAGTSSMKLCTMPPTNEAFYENLLRCHFQVAIWKSALDEVPPNLDPLEYGWEQDHEDMLIPRTVAAGTLSAPNAILQLIHCKCKSSGPGCRTATCSCSKLGCTMFCHCEGGGQCQNPLTRNDLADEEEIDESNDNDIDRLEVTD
jgi:hypothetical protein